MNTPPVSNTLKKAIVDEVDGLADKIRDQARCECADELERAGYPDAAQHLRQR